MSTRSPPPTELLQHLPKQVFPATACGCISLLVMKVNVKFMCHLYQLHMTSWQAFLHINFTFILLFLTLTFPMFLFLDLLFNHIFVRYFKSSPLQENRYKLISCWWSPSVHPWGVNPLTNSFYCHFFWWLHKFDTVQTQNRSIHFISGFTSVTKRLVGRSEVEATISSLK